MILEYRTNTHTWTMMDGDISSCYYMVEKDIKRILEESKKENVRKEIIRLFKRKAFEAGFGTDNPGIRTFMVLSDKDWADIKSIEVVVIERRDSHEIFIFDCDYEFRIRYNDGTIVRKYGNTRK